MRAAIIGLGVIGKVHYQVLRELGEEIVALCDVDLSKLAAYEGPRHYADYTEMLERERIDVVHVCTPHYLHAEMVVEALGRNINVLCEKPLCISSEEIERILQAAKASKGRLGVCFQNRYNHSSLYAKRYLEGKSIDRAQGILRWHRDAAYYATGAWRGKWATEGGGVLINQAIHTVDLLQWLVGMPAMVQGETSNRSLAGVIEVEDTAEARFWGGGEFSLFATNASPQDYPIELHIEAAGHTLLVTPDRVVLDGAEVDVTSEGYLGKASYGNGHHKLIADFYDCVQSGRPFPIDGEEGAKALRLVFAVYRSKGEPTLV